MFYHFTVSSLKERNDKLVVIFIVTERAYLKKDSSVQKKHELLTLTRT